MMSAKEEIKKYLNGLPESKRGDMLTIHKLALKLSPKSKLWFVDGKDAKGKLVSNPNIGYGTYTITYANGTSKEFYRVGISANTVGISVYILGISDKTFLARTYGKKLGKASVTGYCIKFKTLKDIHVDVLEAAIKDRLNARD